MIFIRNTLTCGIYTYKGAQILGPKLLKTMPILSPQQKYDFGLINITELNICNREWSVINKLQQKQD